MKRGRTIAAALAICALGANGVVPLAAAASPTASAAAIKIHCATFHFAHAITITGPPNEAHVGWNCDTATHVIKEGKLSDDRKEFSSPGWNCSRAPTRFPPYTFYCSKQHVLVEFEA